MFLSNGACDWPANAREAHEKLLVTAIRPYSRLCAYNRGRARRRLLYTPIHRPVGWHVMFESLPGVFLCCVWGICGLSRRLQQLARALWRIPPCSKISSKRNQPHNRSINGCGGRCRMCIVLLVGRGLPSGGLGGLRGGPLPCSEQGCVASVPSLGWRLPFVG